MRRVWHHFCDILAKAVEPESKCEKTQTNSKWGTFYRITSQYLKKNKNCQGHESEGNTEERVYVEVD